MNCLISKTIENAVELNKMECAPLKSTLLQSYDRPRGGMGSFKISIAGCLPNKYICFQGRE